MFENGLLNLAFAALQHPCIVGTYCGAAVALIWGKVRAGRYFWLSIGLLAIAVQLVVVFAMIPAAPVLRGLCAQGCGAETATIMLVASVVVAFVGMLLVGGLRVWVAPLAEDNTPDTFV